MTQTDIDNAANILRAILDFCNENEGNSIELYNENPNWKDDNCRFCIGVCNSFGVMVQHYGNSLTECLEKAGIKVEPFKT